jgi:hypothetical protein
MKDGTTDVGAGEGREWCLAFLAIELGSPDQPQQAHLLEIIAGFTAAAGVVQGNGTHQIAIELNAVIALGDAAGRIG